MDGLRPGSTVGLIAGWGRFPLIVTEALRREGFRVACAGIRGHADPQLQEQCDWFRWFGVAKLGGHLRFFRRHRAQHMTMAGKLFKAKLMYGMSIWTHMPDLLCIRTFGSHFITKQRDTRDDTLMLAVTNAYMTRGIAVCAATDFAPELLVKEGQYSGRQLSPTVQKDVEFGWSIAKQMGGMDVGQSITVNNQTVLAVEAIEGTDACIERTGQLSGKKGFTLIKVSKPNQDMRFDVPTIGPQTIQRVADAGGTCIVVEADKTIVVDMDEVVRLANRHRIALVAMRDDQLSVPDRVAA